MFILYTSAVNSVLNVAMPKPLLQCDTHLGVETLDKGLGVAHSPHTSNVLFLVCVRCRRSHCSLSPPTVGGAPAPSGPWRSLLSALLNDEPKKSQTQRPHTHAPAAAAVEYELVNVAAQTRKSTCQSAIALSSLQAY